MLYKIKFKDPEKKSDIDKTTTPIKQFIGNLELDFINHQKRKAYNTIVFVGENGCGKTTILQLSAQSHSVPKDKDHVSPEVMYVDYFDLKGSFDGEPVALRYLHPDDNTRLAEFIAIPLEQYFDGESEGQRLSTANMSTEVHRDKCIYLESEVKFAYKGENALFSHYNDRYLDCMIKEDYSSLVQKIMDMPHRHYFKFKAKVDEFFAGHNLEFVGIKQDGSGDYEVLFGRNSTEIPIGELSSGEKQIVYRTAEILLSNKLGNNPVVIIDEPELNMHPKWQQRILQYYRDLCTQAREQSMQLFIATHSERVVEEALKDDENVLVIILKEKDGKIEFSPVEQDMLLLPSPTAAEVNYLAFNVPTIDYHISLYGYLQELSGKGSVKECDAYTEDYIEKHYLNNKHSYMKDYKYNNTTYKTLPTYIRNAIHHPDSGRKYSPEEFERSIELLREMLQDLKNNSVPN